MREVISIHVGQAGVQIGNACCMCFPSLFAYTIMAWKTHGKTRRFRCCELYFNGMMLI
jgi:hypothetical protein